MAVRYTMMACEALPVCSSRIPVLIAVAAITPVLRVVQMMLMACFLARLSMVGARAVMPAGGVHRHTNVALCLCNVFLFNINDNRM